MDLTGAVSRLDSWLNQLTGFGIQGRDRAASTHFRKDLWLTWAELSDLFHYDALCRRIVSIFPQEALRRKWTIEGPDKQRAAQITKILKQLEVVQKVRAAAIWGRLFGGSVVVLGIPQNVDPREELDIEGPTPIRFLDVYDVRRVWWDLTYSDPRTPSYAKAQVFRITPMYGQQFFVHRSRCLVFGGALTADQERETRAGWDASILQAPYDKIRDFQNSYGSLVHLLSDASTAVFKIRGLLDMIANKTNEDVSTRMQLMDLMRSVFRSVVLDADHEESFDKVGTQFAGVGDVVEHINGLISSVTEIPQTVLFGRSPAGMNATGESDIRIWYDRIESYHKEEIEPQLERIIEIIAPGEGYKFKFVPLWQPLPKEAAQTRKANADADAVYLDREVLMPEEVGRARFSPDGEQEITLDPALRQQAGITATTLPPTVTAATAPTTMK